MNPEHKNFVMVSGIKLLTIVSLGMTAYLVFRLTQGAYITTFHDFPSHCREATENIAAIMFRNGKSPYYENFPHYYTGYGPIYYWITSLLLSSDSLLEAAFVQRGLNWGFVFSTMFIFVMLCRKKIPNCFMESLTLAVVLGVMLAYFSNEMGSKPGCLAFFFAFLGSIYPYYCNFSQRSFIIAITCCAVAFSSKQMFVGFAIAILGYHLLAFGFKRTIFLFMLFIMQSYGFIFLLENIYPNITATFSPTTVTLLGMNITISLARINQIIFLTFSVMLFVIISFLIDINKYFQYNKLRSFHLFIKKNYLTYVCCFLFLYYVLLSSHGGNNNIYAAHTFISFMFLAFLQYSDTYKNIIIKYVSIISLIIILITTISFFEKSFRRMKRDYSDSWHEWSAIILRHDKIYAHRSFAQILAGHGKHVEVFGQEEFMVPQNFYFYKDELTLRKFDSIISVKNTIDSAGYDLLLLEMREGKGVFWWGENMSEEDLFAKGYRKIGEGDVNTAWVGYRIGVFKRAADIHATP